MTNTIQQSVDFKGVDPSRLFQMYMDPKHHAAAIGGPVEMDPKVGGRFSAFGGLTGRFVHIESPRLVVQTWRANVWRAHDPDSVLILTFERASGGARVHLVQANVPEHISEVIDRGWHQHYWTRWAQYLADPRGSLVH